MNKMNLRDDWKLTGSGLSGLAEILKELSLKTQLIPFCNQTDDEADGVYTITGYHDNAEKAGIMTAYRNGRNVSVVGIDALAEETHSKEVVPECINTTGCFIRNEGKTYLLSEYAYLTMTQRLGMGTCISIASKERDAFMEYIMKKSDQPWTICVRKTGDGKGHLKKIFACFTSKYAPISQMHVVKLAEIFELGGTELGAGVVGRWEVSHEKTEVDIEFPDVAFEISETYGLPSKYTPVVRIITSDVGYYPFTVMAMLQKSTGATVLVKELEIRHRGLKSPSVEAIMKKVEDTLYPEFTKLPKQLMALISIPVDKPDDFIQNMAKKLHLAKNIGKKNAIAIVNLLKESLNPEEFYNAYDIVSLFMELPEKLGGLPEYLKKVFCECCGKAPYVVEVKELEEDPELYLM